MVKKLNESFWIGVLVAAVLSFSVFAQSLQAQKSKIFESGVVGGVPYASTDFENVNLTNGNLNLNFPLASLQGRGAAGYTYSLQYDSKLWHSESSPVFSAGYTPNPTYQDFLASRPGGGWKKREAYYPELRNRYEKADYPTGNPCLSGVRWKIAYRWKMEMNFPDSSKVEFRPAGYSDILPGEYNDDAEGYFNVKPDGSVTTVTGSTENCNHSDSAPSGTRMTYYSSDGSGMRLTFANAEALGYVWELSLPDGSRVVQLSDQQRIYDRNGNYIKSAMITLPAPYSTQAPGWVDEFGRYIAKKEGTAPDEDTYFQLGYDGVLLTWKVRWKTIYIKKNYTTTCNSCGGARGPVIDNVATDAPRVVDQIELPNGLIYTFDYYAKNVNDANESPGWGEVKSVTIPTGAKVSYSYKLSTFQTALENESPEVEPGEIYLRVNQILDRAGTINKKKLEYTETYDSISTPKEEFWGYNIGWTSSSVTAPNGGVTTQHYWDIVNNKQKGGQVYKVINPDGSIVERVWANNLPTEIIYGSTNHLNPYVQKEITTIPGNGGSPALIAFKDYTIDGNFNQREVREYEFLTYSSGAITRDTNGIASGVSGATLKRKTVTDYYNSVTTSSANAYWNATAPALRNLSKSVEVQTANGTPVSRAEMFYDYTTYSSNTKGGNVTETKVWDSFKNNTVQAYSNPLTVTNSISTTAQYDQYGNPTLTTDAKGFQTQITYGAVGGHTGLYPTQTITAYGTSVQRTSTAEYDFYTGRITKATDVDNAVSTETDYDNLGRPTKVMAAIGTAEEVWTQTEYDDNNRRIITRSDIAVKGDGRRVATQFFDQLGRVRLSKTLEDAGVQSATNETDGIKVQTRYLTANPYSYQLVSNPYRAATAAGASSEPEIGWTMTKSINTGKSSQVETFSGAALPAAFGGNNANSTGVVKTDLDADRTLVTDQAGKKRISKMNALGHLTDVWEVTPSDTATVAVTFPTDGSVTHGYRTSYDYDLLNNLKTVSQGSQTRSFSYSSLSRLLSAANPESGTISYQYDNNGNLTSKTDARPVTTTYTYDELNRVKTRSYSDGITPQVTYTYDNKTNAKGLLTKVTNGFSTTEYLSFDKLGRVISNQQATDGVTYDPMTYKYNLAGALTEQKYPNGREVKNEFDADGSLSVVKSKKSQSAGFWNYAQHFTYTASGAVSSMQLGNGRWESTTFNARMQPTQIALGSVQNGTEQQKTDQLKLDYLYGTWEGATLNQTKNNGNVAQQMITVPTVGTPNPGFTATQTYTYDSLNRIFEAKETVGSQTWKQTFKYDRYGNRTFNEAETTTLTKLCSESGAPSVCPNHRELENPEIDPLNNRIKEFQPDGSGDKDYEFDTAGNTKKDAFGKTFTYDGENKQVKVESGGSVIGEYWYDGDGKRVKKRGFYNSQWEETIFIYDASGRLVAEYSNVVATAEYAKVRYLTSDHLGSPRITTDKDGAVISRRDFMPFGEEISTTQRTTGLGYTADTVRQKFTSYERDNETELDFAQARYYSSRIGRFISADYNDNNKAVTLPFSELVNPQTLNLFSYANNNPLLFTDVDGHNVRHPIPGSPGYTMRIDQRDTDFPNMHIFDRKGREIGRMAYKGTPENPDPQWKDKGKGLYVPESVRRNVEREVVRRGIQPRPPLGSTNPNPTRGNRGGSGGQGGGPVPGGRRGGRGGGAAGAAFAGFTALDLLLQIAIAKTDSDRYGYFSNSENQIVITNFAKASENLPQNQSYTFEGVTFILINGTFVSTESECKLCTLKTDKDDRIYIDKSECKDCCCE